MAIANTLDYVEQLTQQNKALMLQNQMLEVQTKQPQNIKSYHMINIEVVIITIHPFEILQKGRVNIREVGLMTTIL